MSADNKNAGNTTIMMMRGYLSTAKKNTQDYQVKLVNWLHDNQLFIKHKLQQYALLMRLDRPIGSFLLLWPTLWALWIATEGLPSAHLLSVFITGVFLTRSAGVVMNDYADRDFDAHVERTKMRPLATGKVSAREALAVAVVLTACAFLLVLTTNRLTVLLSFVAIPLAVIYPYMKRHTYVPQFFMGLAFSWGVPMAFAAQTNAVPRIAWLLFIANILWAMVYDTIYAMVDREDDIKIGVKSTAILFDDADRVFIGIFQAMLIAVFIIIGKQLQLGTFYFSALLAAAGLCIYHQYLIKDRLPAQCFKAFLNNNWLGAIVFAGIVLHYLFNT